MKYLFFILVFIIKILLYSEQNINISNGYIFDGEPYIVCNPQNPQHLIVAWIGYILGQNTVIKTRVSFNGGETWQPISYIPHVTPNNKSADPSLGFDNNGRVYLCYIDYNKELCTGGVYVVSSDNGGLTWNTPVKAIDISDDNFKAPIDRPWMVIDNNLTSAYQNRIYITSINPDGESIDTAISPPFHPYFTYSSDNGQSFTPVRHLDTINYLSGSLYRSMASPAVLSDGTFYTIYFSYEPSQSPIPWMISAYSVDGGASFNHNFAFPLLTQPIYNQYVKKNIFTYK